MTELDKKRLSVELLRVTAAKEELNLRILEREDEVNRIKEMIVAQELKEEEIKEKLDIK